MSIRMRRSRPWLAGLGLALSLLGAGGRATADDAAEADLQFELAMSRYAASDWLGALEHFLASNRLSPNRRVAFNVARCYELLQRYPEAYRAYGDALEGEPKQERRQLIEESLERLSSRVAILDVRTEPAGATLFLQRKDLGARGASPRRLGVANDTYVVLAELPGYEPATSAPVTTTTGQVTSVTLKLVRILGTLSIEGPERGAAVRIDDAPAALCTVPCEANLPPGRHSVSVSRAGSASWERQVEITAKGRLVVQPALSALMGSLIVSADVSDALVEVDGKSVGFTPAVLQVPVGRRRLKVSRSGYRPHEETLDVEVSKDLKVEVRLGESVEVTGASRTAESIDEAPASVTVISGPELRAMGYPTIAESLRGIRGVYLSDDRAYTSVGFRGFSREGDYGNRVLVTVDGQSTNDDYIGSSFVGFDGRADLADVERIEVIRGPGSALYGTGAFFGVVNVVTRYRDAPTHVEAGISAVDVGVVRARVHATYRAGPDAGVWISASTAYTPTGRDFQFSEYQDATSDGRVVGRDGFQAYTVNGRAYDGPVTIQWLWTERDKRMPTGVAETTPGETSYLDRRGFLELRYEPKLGPDVDALTRVHLDYYGFRGVYGRAAADGGQETDDFTGIWGGLEQRFVVRPSSALRLTIGGELQRHVRTHQQGVDANGSLLDRNDPFSIGAAYAIVDWTPSRAFKLSPAVRLDAYSTFGASLNPRLAALVFGAHGTVVKVLAGKAFRAPSVYELYYVSASQRAPESLRPEDVWSGELEVSQRLGADFTATLAGYTNYVRNLVVLRGDGTDVSPNFYANSASPVLTVGAEAEVRREWSEGWAFSGQVSTQRSRYTSNDGSLREVPNSPWLMGAFKAAAPIVPRLLGLASRVTYVSPRWDRNDAKGDPAQGSTEPAIVWDLTLSGEVAQGQVRYTLGLYNLLDWRWSTPVSAEFRQRTMLQSGRTVLASLDFRL